jgi:uncharacterized LabA/DUF88 family protein
MKIHATNFAYIDGANLHKGTEELGWKMDYKRFRTWLYEKYGVKTAYIFIGLIPKNKGLYERLQEYGFTLKFKEVVYDGETGKPKGNCDADLVLNATKDVYEGHFDKAIIVASDGDYASLVEFLKEKGTLGSILSPNNPKKCSILLKRTGAPISYLNDQRSLLEAR